MKENEIIIQALKKYDLALPLSWLEKRRISRAKRRTLAVILSRDSGGRFRFSASIFFSDMMKALGMDATLAAGWRAASVSAVFALLLIAGGSLLVIQQRVAIPGFNETAVIYSAMGSVSAGEGIVTGSCGSVKLEAGAGVNSGDMVTVHGGSPLLMKMVNGAAVSVLSGGSIKPEYSENRSVIHLSEGCIISNVPSPFSGVYEVSTPDAVVTVKGTVFAVIHNGSKTSVFVSEGVVNLKHISSGFISDIEAGYYAEAGAEAKKRKLSKKERELLNAFEIAAEDASLLPELNRIYDSIINKKESQGRMTLDDIREKYGQIDEVLLYSGKRYTGAIITRSDKMKIQTENGIISVPAKDVRNVIPE